jgi:hypothetical protein
MADTMARSSKMERNMSVSTEYLTRRLEQTQEENEGLHELAGFWRESAGELKEEAEKEIERLQEMHRKNCKQVRTLLNTGLKFSDEVRSVLHAVEQRSMAALGAKE